MKTFGILFLFLMGCTVPKIKQEPTPVVELVQPDLSAYYSLSHVKPLKDWQLKPIITAVDKRDCKHDQRLCDFIKPAVRLSTKSHILNWKNTEVMESDSLDMNLKVLRKVRSEQIIKNVNNVGGQCPGQFTSALIKKLESQRDETEVWNAMVSLYSKISSCEITFDTEVTHFRMALMFRMAGNNEESAKILNKLLVMKNPQERSRTLYWAGVVLNQPELHHQLMAERPYTWHAVMASQKLGINLYDLLNKRTQLLENIKENDFTTIIEQLVLQSPETAFKLLNNNIDHQMFKDDLGYLLYLVKLVSKQGRIDYTPRLVSKIAQIHSEQLNPQFLKLAYINPHQNLFESVAPDTDPFLLLALSKQESGFYPKATSRVKAKGLMQLMPGTARTISKSKSRDLYNVENNIYLGSTYFKGLFQKYNSAELALAGYNAGPARVNQWLITYPTEELPLFLDLIPFKETRQYVGAILRNNYFYYEVYDSKPSTAVAIKSNLLNPQIAK